MDKDFTPNDLVRLLYNETSSTEANDMRQAMKTDLDFKEDFTEMQEAYALLPKAKFSPSKNAIQNILRYSEQSLVIA